MSQKMASSSRADDLASCAGVNMPNAIIIHAIMKSRSRQEEDSSGGLSSHDALPKKPKL
jgi:hypothetical protein